MPTADRFAWRLRYQHGSRLASIARQLMIEVTHGRAHVEFQGPVHLGPGFSLSIPDSGRLSIGANCSFRRGFVCEIEEHGRVTIGHDTVFTSHALIQCTTSIEIGSWCALGQSLQIADGSHTFRDPTRPTAHQGMQFRPIRIGDGVSVLSKCSIVADVGDNSVIGANSVVTRPIPPFSLAVGAPARVVDSWAPDRPDSVAHPADTERPD